MPELPEVEHLRRTLAPRLLGAVVRRVELHRDDVINTQRLSARRLSATRVRRGLLEGARVTSLVRHGKQLAIIAEGDSPALLVQLGMTGQLIYVPAGRQPPRCDHIHITWHMATDLCGDRVIFRDPRRFGGLTLFDSLAQLQAVNWTRLGCDALTIRYPRLHAALRSTSRPVKAALLDQQLVAGIGNIYADESLLRAGIHPLRPGRSLEVDETRRLCQSIRTTLRAAIEAGGTTLRDYVDGNGRGGRNRPDLFAYGRAGQPCRQCGLALEHISVAQRTTTFCPQCQP